MRQRWHSSILNVHSFRAGDCDTDHCPVVVKVRERLAVSKQEAPSRRCLHFEVVGGLEWSNDPESYAGGSVATGRASLAGKVKGDDSD